MQNVYGKNDNVLFVLAPAGGEVFTAPVLAAVEHLTEQAWQIPFATRVDSVTNFQHTRAEGDDLFVADLVSDANTQPPEVLQEARQVALNEPLLVNRLISPSAHVTGVNVTLHFAGKSITEVPEVAAHARRLADEIRAAYPDVKVYLTGLSMLNNAFSEAGLQDMQTLVPLMYLAMFVIMFWLLRSLTSTFGTLLIVGFSAASAMGLAGWMGTGLTPPSAQAATMIMTLAVADSIHLLVTMLHEMRQGREKREAIVESLRINMQPIFLTSLTTSIGFLSMNFSDSPPFRHLGNITATGVGIAFVLSVVFLPAVMSVLPVRVKQRASSGRFSIEWLAEAVVSRRRMLLYGSIPVILGLALCIPLNELNDRFLHYFGERIEFRTHSDFAINNLGGMFQSEHSVGSDSSNGISEPAYMAKLEEFADWYRAQPEVTARQRHHRHHEAPQQEHARRRSGMVSPARQPPARRPVPAAVRIVPALRPGPEQPDQPRQVGDAHNRHAQRHHGPGNPRHRGSAARTGCAPTPRKRCSGWRRAPTSCFRTSRSATSTACWAARHWP